MSRERDKSPDVFNTITPGCACSRCARLKKIQEDGPPDGKEQMGRAQKYATELGWNDGGSDHQGDGLYGHLRPAERADREEREAYGKPLSAAYRTLIGPSPDLKFGDRVAAKSYLMKIEAAIEQGGWTRNECARLYRMRDKWKARASGEDARFNIVGNRRGGLEPHEASMVKFKRITDEMRKILERSGHSNGD